LCHNWDSKQKQLKIILEELKDCFDRTLGSWNDQQINLELKENISIPKSRGKTKE